MQVIVIKNYNVSNSMSPIAIICYAACDVIKLEINLSFLIRPFSYMTKKSGQKCKYKIIHYFQRAFSCQELIQT